MPYPDTGTLSLLEDVLALKAVVLRVVVMKVVVLKVV